MERKGMCRKERKRVVRKGGDERRGKEGGDGRRGERRRVLLDHSLSVH